MNAFASTKSRQSPRRWQVALAILFAGPLAMSAVQAGFLSLTGKPSRDFTILLAAWELAFYVWVRTRCGMDLAGQARVLILFVGLQACLYSLVRLEGFTGDARMILAWRWTPTPEQVFEKSIKPPTAVNEEAIDLTRTTKWDYPAFRGADRSGKAEPVKLQTDWKQFPPRQLWRQPIGRGWSSFAVVGEYCVTQEQRFENEVVVCYQLRTGREVWAHRDQARFDEPTGGVGPRATPTIYDGNVYTLGATGILNCLKGANGQRLWSVNILQQHGVANRLFGMVGSPLVVDSMIVVSPGGPGSSLAAYDVQTGALRWKGGDADASYSSPQMAHLGGQTQILNFNARGLFAHDLHTGDVLWSLPWVSNPAERNNVCQPVVLNREGHEDADQVMISSGYGMGCATLSIRRTNGRFAVEEKWRSRNLNAKFSSVVIHQGYAFGFDGALLTCIDLNTGLRQWKGGHYGYGQLMLVDSLLLVQLESGDVALVEATPRAHREMARFSAIEGRTWNHPCLSGNRLLVRNDREAACYELTLMEDEE